MSNPNETVTESVVSLMIGLIQSKRIDSRGTELAAEVIAADSRFNRWIYEKLKMGKGPKISDYDLGSLLDSAEDICQRCQSASAAFHAGGGSDALAASLSEILADLNDAPRTQPFWPSPMV